MHTRIMLNLSSQQRSLPTVLLIDDDLVSREVTATVLTMGGYTVHTAADGAAALDLLTDGVCQPGVILADAQMPGLNGAQLVAELRARCRARVFVVSGSNPPAETVSAADGFLLKPFGAEALGKLLEGESAASIRSFLDAKEPVISTEILEQFRRMMPESAVRQIYETVSTDLKQRMEALEAALAKEDVSAVRRLGHAIKGGCGMAGALQIARIGALLEAFPAQDEGNQFDNGAALLRDLRVAAQSLERMLENGLSA
jgi:CheY-like chemotaxis protein